MDNLTHSLLGLTAAKAGLERLSTGTTAICIIAANAPDSDLAVLLVGRWAYLHHHRGITHSIAGTLALALIVPAIFYGFAWLIARARNRRTTVKLKGLLLASLLVTATHPLMDWTNNYGVRPFLPWSAKWYYGDLVFIVDPWFWLVLGGASFLLTANTAFRTALWLLLGLILTVALLVMGPRRFSDYPQHILLLIWIPAVLAFAWAHRARMADVWGPKIAIAALALIPLYWVGLGVVHSYALQRAVTEAAAKAQDRGETTMRVAAMPKFADPSQWRCVAETNTTTFKFDLKLGGESVRNFIWYDKPKGEAAEVVELAASDPRAHIFLGFARFPVSETEGNCLTQFLVRFADLRYTTPGSGGGFTADIPVECEENAEE